MHQSAIFPSFQAVHHQDQFGKEIPHLLTAFGETLTASLTPIWQQSFEYTVSNTDLNTITVAGTGAVTQAAAMANVTTGATAGGKALFIAAHNVKYKAGMGAVARFSCMFTSGIAGTVHYVVLQDKLGTGATFENGLAIGYNGTTMTVARFANDTKYEVVRSSWLDPLDGTGRSGKNIDFTNLNVCYIQYQYLGAGPINFYIEDPDTGYPIIFHTIKYANTYTVPSSYNPNYSLSVFADNLAVNSTVTCKVASWGFFIEGDVETSTVSQPQYTTGSKQKTTVTTEVAIFTIRNKSTYASKTNFIDIVLERLSSSIEANTANNLGTVRLVKNTTLGGVPVYADISTANSIIEIDVAGTTLTGGKELISIDLAGKNDRNFENLLGYKVFLHPNETITLAGSSANSATIKGSLLWKELV